MSAVIEADGLGKRYRRQWALTDCTLSIPAGHVVGLVGPNGAGKTTLLNLAVGLLAPDAGTIEVLGGRPAAARVEAKRRTCSAISSSRGIGTANHPSAIRAALAIAAFTCAPIRIGGLGDCFGLGRMLTS